MSRDNFDKLREIILLVDDNYTNIELLKNILEKDGYEIAFASNGEQALKLATKLNPNLILLDIMMPGIDGFEVCQRLKENKMTRGIPVIFISAKSKHEDIVKGFEIGGTDYITKPFNISEVLARVRTHLQIQNLMAQKEKSKEKAKAYAQELKRSNQDLEDFAQLASHDLQEPLRKVMTFGDRLQNRLANSDEESIDDINRMQSATIRMQQLIDDLLSYAKVTTKTQPFKGIDFDQAVKEALFNLEDSISESKGIVNFEALPIIEADPVQIRQLFQNLIGNALKYCEKGVAPVVNISSQPASDNKIAILVEDNGIGFEEKYADRIFRLFQRLHGRSEYSGTGMGLAICKKIVERHGGTITAESVLGKGSTFIITLPAKQM